MKPIVHTDVVSMCIIIINIIILVVAFMVVYNDDEPIHRIVSLISSNDSLRYIRFLRLFYFSKRPGQNLLDSFGGDHLVVVIFRFGPQDFFQFFLLFLDRLGNNGLLGRRHGIPCALVSLEGSHQQAVQLFFQLVLAVVKDLVGKDIVVVVVVIVILVVVPPVGHLVDAVGVGLPVGCIGVG
jgi:hypothetical protein